MARDCGVDISGQRARQVKSQDFSRFDRIFGMDRANVRALRQKAPEGAHGRIHLFLHHALGQDEEVLDPYYGSEERFAAVCQTIREACEALATRLSERDDSALSSGHTSSTT
ncbi:arsenate reductase/protein-tyrosine-phosphatase family protein [Chelativorans sp. YIM 93263]|uniref:arsenate reductase/protein-tyrosine-phosphatase family protein n=1 Tax=Chelativorans sp. YIM 93263 TaxID=2906648 RepID=UPI00403D5B4B